MDDYITSAEQAQTLAIRDVHVERNGRGFGFRDVTGLGSTQVQAQRNKFQAPAPMLWVNQGADVRINPVDEVWVLGTPEDLERFNREYQA